jgi:hypothetical protein
VPHAPVVVVPQLWPDVERAQPVVSVSVVGTMPQLPSLQIASVRVRVRVPDSLQGEA